MAVAQRKLTVSGEWSIRSARICFTRPRRCQVPIEFASSPRSTLGVEWELALVDPESRELTGAAPAILEQLDGDRSSYPQITEELLTNTVEIVSGAHARVDEAVADLAQLLRDVRSVAL